MKKLVIMVVLLFGMFSVPVSAEETNACVPMEYNGHSYKLFTTQATWTQAKKNCLSFGGHLATISSAEENAFIKSLCNNSSPWIGGYGTSSSWKWTTGETWGEFTNWSSSSATKASSTNAIRILSSGKWYSFPNSNSLSYICEWDYINTQECHDYKATLNYVCIDKKYDYRIFECNTCGKTQNSSEKYEHSWKKDDTYSKYDKETHLVHYICNHCKTATKNEHEKHTWKLVNRTYNDENTHFMNYECTVCGDIKSEKAEHNWKHLDYTLSNKDEHLNNFQCTGCSEIKSVPETHTWLMTNPYITKNNEEYHSENYQCSKCNDTKKEDVEHDWIDLFDCKKIDDKYHECLYECSICKEKKTVKENHYWEKEEYNYLKADNNYHKEKYYCYRCNGEKYDGKLRHSWEIVSYSKYASLTSPGKYKAVCSDCNATIQRSFKWKYGGEGSLDYDIDYHSDVYKNSKKITVTLKQPSKGCLLKIKIGKRTYKKKIKNNKKKIKIKIKKPKYGKTIKVTLLYKGQIIGRENWPDNDCVYYAKKIKKGMTKNQVGNTCYWGWPSSTGSYSGGWTFWYYDDGSFVGFKNGKVKTWYNAG